MARTTEGPPVATAGPPNWSSSVPDGQASKPNAATPQAGDLEPDRDALEIFVDAVLRYRGTEGFLSLRSFYDDEDGSKKDIHPVSLKGNFNFLIDSAVDCARRAAQHPRPVVFCPPTCVFGNADHAGEKDVLAGLVPLHRGFDSLNVT